MPWHGEQGRALSTVLRFLAHSLLFLLSASRLSLHVCFHDPCGALAASRFYSYLTFPNQTHPSHRSCIQASQNCNNTMPGLSVNLPPVLKQGRLGSGQARLTSNSCLQLQRITPCLPIRYKTNYRACAQHSDIL